MAVTKRFEEAPKLLIWVSHYFYLESGSLNIVLLVIELHFKVLREINNLPISMSSKKLYKLQPIIIDSYLFFQVGPVTSRNISLT